MIVMKFGGTSVGNADAISQVASVVKRYFARRPVVVVSAITKITDALIHLQKKHRGEREAIRCSLFVQSTNIPARRWA
jgi:aspartokinase